MGVFVLLLFVAFVHAGPVEDQLYATDFCSANPGYCTDPANYCVVGDPEFAPVFTCEDGLIVEHRYLLDGTIPTSISGVTNLRALRIERVNNVAYSLPSQVGALTALNELHLDGAGGVILLASLPSQLENLVDLRLFELKDHVVNFGNALPAQVGNGWNQIRGVSITGNEFTGTLPAVLGPGWRDTLRSIEIINNDFPTMTLPRFAHAPQFEHYVVTQNFADLTFDDPALLTSPQLEHVEFTNNNNFHGTIPSAALYSSGSLEELIVGNNGSPGIALTITPDIGRLNNTLDTLILVVGSSIVGTIPTQLGALSHLTTLTLAFTQLDGTIPTTIRALEELRSLSLSSAPSADCSASPRLYGTFPAELAELVTRSSSTIEQLGIIGNCFTGTIPGGILRNTNLLGGTVRISATSFVDPLPPWLTTVAANMISPQCDLRFNRFCHVPRPYQQSELTCPITYDGVIDRCGVCDGIDNLCIDCDGVLHGTSVLDLCGVCNGNSQDCMDCNGVPYGSKQLDECGVCGGSNECQDCTGSTTGSLRYDRCGVCGGNGGSCLDCNGVVFGTAEIDVCGVCGGLSDCIDCAGVVNGTSIYDECGICADVRNPAYRPACFDCSGIAFGSAIRDVCGKCPASLHCNTGIIALVHILYETLWVWWIIIVLAILTALILLAAVLRRRRFFKEK